MVGGWGGGSHWLSGLSFQNPGCLCSTPYLSFIPLASCWGSHAVYLRRRWCCPASPKQMEGPCSLLVPAWDMLLSPPYLEHQVVRLAWQREAVRWSRRVWS